VDRTSFKDMETVNIGNLNISAGVTSTITAFGNLPSQDTGQTDPGAPFVTSSEVFTALGESQRVSFSWAPGTTANTWDLAIADQNGNGLGSVTIEFNNAGPAAGSPLSYSNINSTATAPAAFTVDPATGVATITLDNGVVPQEIDITLGKPGAFDGISQ
ncbi:MAG TPA: flagellar hook protein, partial [Sulfitobacter sp.]|nr:flagellar hook protein [Sulfitobacter sp.]